MISLRTSINFIATAVAFALVTHFALSVSQSNVSAADCFIPSDPVLESYEDAWPQGTAICGTTTCALFRFRIPEHYAFADCTVLSLTSKCGNGTMTKYAETWVNCDGEVCEYVPDVTNNETMPCAVIEECPEED